MATKKKKAAARKSKNNTSQRKGMHFSAAAGILALAAILSALFLYIDGAGVLSVMIRNFLLALFSVSAYLLPPVFAGLAVYVSNAKSTDKLGVKLILSFISCIIISALYQVFTDGILDYSALISYGESLMGGGLLGGILANVFCRLIGKAATVVIFIFLLAAAISVITKVSLIGVFTSFVSGFSKMKNEIKEVNYEESYERGKKAGEKLAVSAKEQRNKRKNIDFTVEDDEGEKSKTQSKSVISKKDKNTPVSKEDLQIRIDEILFNPDIPIDDVENDKKSEKKEQKRNIENINAEEIPDEEIEEDISMGGTLDDVEQEPDSEPATETAVKSDLGSEKAKAEEAVKDEKKEKSKRVDNVSEEEKEKIKGEIEDSIDIPQKEYVFPPVNLLKKPQATSSDKRREMQETANKLMEILRNFGVEAKLIQVTQGPTVTRYEIQPHTGIKLSKITGLAEDIALNLAVPTVLVAPVPGKAAVGIEVPNTVVNTVSVRELLESTKFRDAKSKLTVALGKDIGGNVVVGDIAKMPHVLIAGSTGSGKSVCINTIITSILYKANPDEVKLIMVDPKVVELGVYNGIPHLLIPVVTDPKRAAGALNWAVSEMMRRYGLFAETGSRNLSGYNELMDKNGEKRLPQIVIIIDELADLMMVAAKEVEDYVCRLAQLARAAGIHLIIATQRPSVDVITGLIKANVPSRIAFAVSSQVDSRTILDKGGAEKLLGKGDMLYHPIGLSNALRVQGAFVSDSEIENIVTFIKENSEVTHYSEDLEEHLDRVASGDVSTEESKEDDDADELLPQAIELAAELGQISTAMIQRRLKVGYARAGRIIDQMEAREIISGANGSKPREVYLNRINMSDYDVT